MSNLLSFELYEDIGISIPNPGSVVIVDGPPELMAKLDEFLNTYEWDDKNEQWVLARDILHYT